MSSWYTTVEALSKALGAKSTAFSDSDIRRAVAAGSADVDDVVQWVPGAFRPWRTTLYFDWPSKQTASYYKLYLDANPLISVELLTAGGLSLPPSNFFLEPSAYGPPYKRIEINRGTSSAFSYSAGTPQHAVGVLGLWGLGDQRADGGTLVGTVNASTTVLVCSDGSRLGIGDHIVIDTERMEVTGKTWSNTATLAAPGLTASSAGTSFTLSAGAVLAGELLLIDSERVLVLDVAGSTIIVQRAQDGTVLAAHTTGATVWARRGLTVTRAAQGTIAGGHTTGVAISRHAVPGDVEALAIASGIVTHLSEQSGYSNSGAGSGATATVAPGQKAKPMVQSNLDQLRDRVLSNYGRQVRSRVI